MRENEKTLRQIYDLAYDEALDGWGWNNKRWNREQAREHACDAVVAEGIKRYEANRVWPPPSDAIEKAKQELVEWFVRPDRPTTAVYRCAIDAILAPLAEAKRAAETKQEKRDE